MRPRVVIVDDSLTVRMDLEEAFGDAGFDITLCSTLRAAREALTREACDLIVLDILFPDGNGFDLLEELRSSPQTSDIPIIFLSSQTAVADRIRGLKAGAHDYAGKPYDRTYLISRAKELVEARKESKPSSDRVSRILVIEDSLTFREAMRAALESAEYEVIESPSGVDGLRQAAQFRPQAILVDGNLPDIDGATVIQRLRLDPALRGTPCMLLTASLNRDEELKALAAGADTYVRKDQGMSVLLARIGALLRSEKASSLDENQASLFGPKKILTVDDSETYLQELAAALRNDGYEVVMARSGKEALDLLVVQPVDCILLDMLMPELSGQETCRRIKVSPAWRDIPVLMLTAREDREAMLEGINAGADDYIAKSSDFEVVRARLRAQLRRKHFEAENRHIRDELHRKEMEATQERAARKMAEARATLLEALEAKTKELLESQERLARIVETIADAIFIVDHTGQVTFANVAAEKMLGLSRETMTARTYNDPLWRITRPDGDPYPDEDLPHARVMRTGEPVYGAELALECGDGSRIVISLNAAPLRDPTGTLAGMVASASDVTRRKEVERLKDEFVSTVSHELRTPLSSLRGFAELMLTREFTPEKRRDFLTIIHNESVRLTTLINDFLDIQRMESGRQRYQFTAVSLMSLARECLSVFSSETGKHPLSLEIIEPLPPVWADADRLRQVLSNLVSNAIKFSPRGGKVTVGARTDHGEVVAWVSDKGMGIPQETIPNLFTKFFRVDNQETRSIGGTGLGLALVKEIVEAHSGRVWVESEPGEGSTFFFTLALVHQLPGAVTPSEGSQAMDILLIEDDLAFAQLLCERFALEGLSVTTTTTGEEALELLRSRLPPQAALLDVHLASSVDGWDILLEIKGDPALRSIPILIISVSETINARGLAVAGADYLLKPISPSWLLQVVEAQLSPLSGKRVLVVDDDPAFRLQVIECLAPEGIEVEEAANGREALKRIDERIPDLLLLDLLMPEVDGFEVLHQLRANKRALNLPVLVITCHDLGPEDKTYIKQRLATIVRGREANIEHITQAVAQYLAVPNVIENGGNGTA